jgi:mannose-6-phosphate isomerase
MSYKYFVKLKSARAWRTYIGGKMLDALAGQENPQDSQFPEEWLMSVTRARNAGREDIVEGMNFIAGVSSSVSLKEIIEESPESMLGEKHVKYFGANTGVLAKLIDAAERLTIQVHPSRKDALRLFNSSFGKTECWYCLGGRTINGQVPSVYLGFKEAITKEHWRKLFDKQDIAGMLECLHRFEISEGDIFLIEGGIPHAIGSGCFLVEIQEPTDYTVRVERTSPAGLAVADSMCHQGLGFEKMFDCFHYQGFPREEVLHRWKLKPLITCIEGDATVTQLVGYSDTPFFKMELITIPKGRGIVLHEDVFSGIYILAGNGSMHHKEEEIAFCKGNQFFLPASGEDIFIKALADCKLLRCFGPRIPGSN